MLELTDPGASSAQLRRFLGRVALAETVIDVVLAQPGVLGDLVDAEIGPGLFDGSALAHE